MIFSILITCYVILSFFFILLVMIQKSKGSNGLNAITGQNQMLFGASGGQNIFQKATWILGVLIMGCSLSLALLNMQEVNSSKFIKTEQSEQS